MDHGEIPPRPLSVLEALEQSQRDIADGTIYDFDQVLAEMRQMIDEHVAANKAKEDAQRQP